MLFSEPLPEPVRARFNPQLQRIHILAGLIVAGFVAMFLLRPESGSTAISATEKVDSCGTDIACLADALQVQANSACKTAIESRLSYQHEWTGTFGQVFDNVAVVGENAAYTGKHLRTQNAFGAWRNPTYVCFYDVRNRAVVDTLLE